jgi:hypothetical protein
MEISPPFNIIPKLVQLDVDVLSVRSIFLDSGHFVGTTAVLEHSTAHSGMCFSHGKAVTLRFLYS